MQMAPPSCRAATNSAPSATMALVTAKLPLPINPKTCGGPRRARARPTASATCTLAPEGLTRHQRQHAGWTARAADDGQRRGDEYRTGGGQARQVGQLGQAIFSGAEEEGMAREGGLEA